MDALCLFLKDFAMNKTKQDILEEYKGRVLLERPIHVWMKQMVLKEDQFEVELVMLREFYVESY